MKFLRVLVFMLSFSVEIRVHADLVQLPDDCIKSQSYCVFRAKSKKEFVKTDDVELSLQPDSTLIRQSENKYSFVKGVFLIKANQKATVETSYGKIILESGAQVLLQKEIDRVNIQTIFGKALIEPLGAKKSLYVLEGCENYVSEVDNSLAAQTGIPKPILIDPFLKNWASLSNEPKKDFLEEVDRFKEIHEKAVKDLSILNTQIVQREIASVENQKKSEMERAQREKALKKQQQDLYYRHLLEE